MRLMPMLALVFVIPISGAEEKKVAVEVKAIDVSELKQGRGLGKVTNPTGVTSREDLEKAISNDSVRERVLKEVNFEKQQLVLFHWSGSGQDKVTPVTRDGKVVFEVKRGLTKDLRNHALLFALAKETKWSVEAR